MLKIKKIFKIAAIFFMVLMLIILIVFSDICKSGIERGILVCANIIIPALFPFMVCILIIVNMNISINNKLLQKIIFYMFGQNFEMFIVMILSFLGGYPIGCKLINNLYSQNKITKKAANIMQIYCVNAGPAFIISAVGSGIFGSKSIGIILFIAHIMSSVILALCSAKSVRKNFKNIKVNQIKNINFADIFVQCTAEAANCVLTICTYVILFSVINSYLIYFLKDIPVLKNIVFFTEVTLGITYTNNAFFISFLLGLSGLSIWCQILSLSKHAKVDLKLFILGRILHGGISSIITYILIKTLNIKQTVFSNSLLSGKKLYYDNFTLSISLAVMLLILLIYIHSKNNSRKIVYDVI